MEWPFSLELILVVVAGAELFTGNNLLVMTTAGECLARFCGSDHRRAKSGFFSWPMRRCEGREKMPALLQPGNRQAVPEPRRHRGVDIRGRNQLPPPARANNIGAMNAIFSALSPLRNSLLALALPAFGLAVTARAAEPKSSSNRGAALYAACVQCHGEMAEGIETSKAPRLAGREDWFIKKQLEQFRRRQRGKDDSKETGFLPPEERTQSMHPVADKLTRADTKALITHIATFQPEPVPPARLGDAGRGRLLYETCIECHGKTGEGNRRQGAPRLVEQHDWYLFNQLRDFRMGWRGTESKNPHVKFMRSRLDLDDDALHDLAAYIVSLNLQIPAPPAKR